MAQILIVDDDPVVQRMLGYVLEQDGHTIFKANNGAEALQRLEEYDIDLVVSDVRMPVMDGLSLLQRLRQDERYRDLPVIILTVRMKAHEDVPRESRAATDFLTKPISSDELLSTVAHRLNTRNPQP